MKNKNLFIITILPITLASCAFKPVTSSTSSSSSSITSSAESISSEPSSEESIASSETSKFVPTQNSPSIFSLENDVRVSLSFKEGVLGDLCRLDTNGGNSRYYDVYFPCDVSISINGEVTLFEDAGIRMKGNTSRNSICGDDDQINGVCHFKVNLKATFDGTEYDLDDNVSKYKVDWTGKESERAVRKNRAIDGVNKFDLKYLPRNNGGTSGQEVYAYEMFRREGIMSPFATIGPVSVSTPSSTNTYDCEIIETVDKDFLKRRLSKAEAKGDLYKCVYGPKGKADFSRSDAVEKTTDSKGYNIGGWVSNGKIGFEDNVNNYHPCYDLKTNDDDPSTQKFTTMSNLINGLWNLTNKQAPQSLLESLIDMDNFLHFSAISYLFGNPDDQRYNYNNFYLYFMPSTKKAYFIPYDWDWCLGHDWGNHNLSTRGLFDNKNVDGWDLDNNLFYSTFINSNNTLSYDLGPYRNKYKAYAEQGIANGLLDFENYKSLCDSLHTENHLEYSQVQSYMNTKKGALGN